MASFAGAFAASHGPLLIREWEAVPPGEKSRLKSAFESSAGASRRRARTC